MKVQSSIKILHRFCRIAYTFALDTISRLYSPPRWPSILLSCGDRAGEEWLDRITPHRRNTQSAGEIVITRICRQLPTYTKTWRIMSRSQLSKSYVTEVTHIYQKKKIAQMGKFKLRKWNGGKNAESAFIGIARALRDFFGNFVTKKFRRK